MKEKIKQIGIICLTIVLTIFLGVTIVNAESIPGSMKIKSTTIKNIPMSFPANFHIKKTGSKHVYCSTYNRKTPSSGITYKKGSLIKDNGENYILREAYKSAKTNSNYFIYQTAYWIYKQDKKTMTHSNTISTFRNKVYNSNSATAKKIRKIVAEAKKASKNNTSDPTIKLTGSNITFKVDADGKYYVSDKIKVTSSQSSYTISFTNAPSGTTYTKSGNNIYVKVPVKSISKLSTSFKINVKNSKTVYYSYKYNPSNSAYQVMSATYKKSKTASASLSLKLTKDIKLSVLKVDAETNKAVAGAKLQIKDSNNKVVESWTTTKEAYTITNLTSGTYTITETTAPNGYILSDAKTTFTVEADGTIKDSNGTNITSISIENEKNTVNISKQDITNNEELPGATLEVKDSSGAVVEKWVSTNEPHIIKGLTAGTYTLTETNEPEGYVITKETIKFAIDKYGKLTNNNGDEIEKVVMYNTPKKKINVDISKQDITTSKELPGATLVLEDSEEKVIEEWVSTNEPHKIKDIKPGTYKLTETIAPEGYELSTEKVEFTIGEYGEIKDATGKEVEKVIMYNKPVKKLEVTISKQDITTSKELPGASLVVEDSEGNIIDSWVSTNEPHKIKDIKPGTYKLTETIAPEGYVISTETIEFTIDKNNKITNKSGKEIEKVVMYNAPKKKININISKKDITNKEELPGASLTLIDGDNNIIATWISTEKAYTIKDIEPGTYTLKETKAPEGYILSTEEIKFTVDKEGAITNSEGKTIKEVVMYNKPIDKFEVTISKQDIATSKELPGASLTVEDSEGNIIESWVSTNESHKIKDIKPGTYKLTETQAPEGYILSTETITFTIDKNGKLTNESGKEIDKIVMYNKKIPTSDVTISKQDITTSKELPGASLVVKDSANNIIDEWVSTNESHIIKNLKEGTYTLTETGAPAGYVQTTETITFKINDKGQLTNNDGTTIEKVVMYNEQVKKSKNVPFVKIDAKTNEALAGASLELKDSEGNIIENWVSTKEAYYIELEPGTYTLTETQAPKGYILNTKQITFTITNEETITDETSKTINTIIMKNEKEPVITKVSVSKQDITNGKEIPGAHLVVKDKDGEVVDEWISTNTPHMITGLKPGEYTLNEVVAPNGYVLSDETITFTVKEDGSITSVVMYNSPEVPVIPVTPDKPSNGTEIIVENTSSFKSITSSLLGLGTLLLGTLHINKTKKKEE